MSDNLRGIVAMTASMLFFSIGDMLFKVVGVALPIGEMLLVRGIFATVAVVAAAWWMDAFRHVRLILTPLMAVRVACEVACSVLFFFALVRMNFSDTAAIGQFTPLMVMAGAALFLDEPVGWRRWSAAAVGFMGVLLIVKPGTSAFQPMALVVLASMLCVTGRDLITRRLPKETPTVLITLTSAVGGMLIGPVMAPFEVWRPMALGDIAVMALCAGTVLIGYVMIIRAMRVGDTAIVSPFRYTYMAFALIASLIVFNERPDAMSWLGITLILASGLYTLHRERVRRLDALAASAAVVAAR